MMCSNRYLIGVAVLAGTIMMAACSADETGASLPTVEDGDIALTSRVGGTRTASELQTDAVSTSVTVGTFGVSAGTLVTNGNNNQYSVAASGALTPKSKGMKWPSGKVGTVDIFAYAPYQNGWTYNASNTFSVSDDQSTDEGYLASDLLYASATGQTYSASPVALKFQHQLARISVNVTTATDRPADLPSSVDIYIGGTLRTYSFNPSTGKGAVSGSTTKNIKIAKGVNVGKGFTAYAVIVPQTVKKGEKFMKIDTGTSDMVVAKLQSDVTFEEGKTYNFKAVVSPEGIALTLGSVTLSEWGASTDIGNATAQEVLPDPITATFGTPANNATYSAPTYTWTATTSNLMTCFEFSNGELAQYKTLKFTISNLTGGMVRMGYYVGSDFTEFGNGYGSNGLKTVDLTALGINLSTVTKISFGGKTGTGSVDINASDVILSNP